MLLVLVARGGGELLVGLGAIGAGLALGAGAALHNVAYRRMECGGTSLVIHRCGGGRRGPLAAIHRRFCAVVPVIDHIHLG